ncbi:MAG TPA: DMT family transporter [Hyphomicrobiales bacterium]|nr:DMT family transporter [Hyphomicrobiales bacterium]
MQFSNLGTERRSKLQGMALLLLACLFWGVNWPVTKFLITELPPLSARALPGVIGAMLMFALAIGMGERLLPPLNQWRPLVVSSILNYSAWMVLTTTALVWLPASEAVIVAYTLPIWTAFLAYVLLGEIITPYRFFGIVLGLSGVAWLVLNGSHEADSGRVPGIALVLTASILLALGTVLMKRNPILMPPVASVGWQIALGTVPLLLGSLIEKPSLASVDARGWAAVMATALLAMGLGYVCWFAALKRLPASMVAIGALLVPVIGVAASALALGEVFGPREFAALALTLSGVAIASR